MTLVYAMPPIPIPPEVKLWTGMSISWRGWEGSEWELSSARSGVFLRGGGVEGMDMPEQTDWTGQSPAVHGQYYRGHVIEPREVFWPILVYTDKSSDEWLKLDRAFWRSLRPGMHGTWSVTSAGGDTRDLGCRFISNGPHSFEADPSFRGWATYGVTLVADDPFWKGSPVRRTWSQTAESDFFGAGTAPVFNISSGSQLGYATISNDGDVEAWPVWTITGPISAVTVGVDGRSVQWNVALAAEDILVIDTDPTVQSAWLNGKDVTEQLGTADFAPIPSGLERPLSLTMVGTGSVEARITPRYYRAW